MKKLVFLAIAIIALATACNKTENITTMTIASEKRITMGVAPMEVLLVKEDNASEWSYFYSNIEGFYYEPGYEYVLEVKKETKEEPTPSDISNIKYTLVKEISKIKKDSENMPIDISKEDIATMVIASEKRLAMGAAPMEVLLVKENGAEEWSFFYSNIEGFDYESGYEYEIEVKKETIEEPVPADVSSIKYILTKEISKTKKNSENMPADIAKK